MFVAVRKDEAFSRRPNVLHKSTIGLCKVLELFSIRITVFEQADHNLLLENLITFEVQGGLKTGQYL